MAKKMGTKTLEIKRAVEYCRENGCKGYEAIKELGLLHVKDPRTINQHLLGNVITGDEKRSERILSEKEAFLVKYLLLIETEHAKV